MVQEFHVVRCFTCRSFQVQQVKKVNKWSCKLCGEKQTLLKEFGRGSGADCRRHVQKLNAMRGAMMEEQEDRAWSLWEQMEEGEEPEEEQQVSQNQLSRWSKYLDTPEEAEPEEEEQSVLFNREQLHGNNFTDRTRRGRGWTYSCSPEQAPPPSTRAKPNLSRLNQTELDQTGLDWTRPNQFTRPTKRAAPPAGHDAPLNKQLAPPTSGPGPVSRWTQFVGSRCQLNEGEESTGGRCHSDIGASVSACSSDFTKPRPLLPVSSMFESGEEFVLDDSL